MFTCIYSGERFDSSTGEHILQNFLGPRWVSGKIVCNSVQEEFGRGIDLALQDGLKVIRALLGTEGGRGGFGPSVEVQDTDKVNLLMQPGGIAKLNKPSLIPDVSDPNKYTVALSDAKQIPWLAKLITDERPELDRETTKSQLEAHFAATSPKPQPSSAQLELKLRTGGDSFFRGALKAVFNLLGANDPAIALDPRFDALRTFVWKGTGSVEDFVRWPTSQPSQADSIGYANHLIAVFNRGQTIEGYFCVFGVYHWSFRLSGGYQGEDFLYSYRVDPFRGTLGAAEQRNCLESVVNLPEFEVGLKKPNEHVWAASERSFNRLLSDRQDAIQSAEVAELVERALGPPDGRPITPEDLNRVASEMAALIMRKTS